MSPHQHAANYRSFRLAFQLDEQLRRYEDLARRAGDLVAWLSLALTAAALLAAWRAR